MDADVLDKPGAPGLVYGKYRLIERIAAGGMGEVFVAEQFGIGRFARPAAVKLLLAHLVDDEILVKRFLQEAWIHGLLTHPNIVQVYDVGFEHNRYFIAMELVRGLSLSTLIRGMAELREYVSADLIAYIGRALCDGLRFAHELSTPEGVALNLVHRDVTPHNVLLGLDGAVKVADFGLVRVRRSAPSEKSLVVSTGFFETMAVPAGGGAPVAVPVRVVRAPTHVSSNLTAIGQVFGKVEYLSPEQFDGTPPDKRADIYGVGATLFHLAALRRPFDYTGEDWAQRPIAPSLRLEDLRSDLPKELLEAIATGMHPNVKRRFQNMRDFRNALPVPHHDISEELGRLVSRLLSFAEGIPKTRVGLEVSPNAATEDASGRPHDASASKVQARGAVDSAADATSDADSEEVAAQSSGAVTPVDGGPPGGRRGPTRRTSASAVTPAIRGLKGVAAPSNQPRVSMSLVVLLAALVAAGALFGWLLASGIAGRGASGLGAP
jgi:serine/threonine-protein kinase